MGDMAEIWGDIGEIWGRYGGDIGEMVVPVQMLAMYLQWVVGG